MRESQVITFSWFNDDEDDFMIQFKTIKKHYDAIIITTKNKKTKQK